MVCWLIGWADGVGSWEEGREGEGRAGRGWEEMRVRFFGFGHRGFEGHGGGRVCDGEWRRWRDVVEAGIWGILLGVCFGKEGGRGERWVAFGEWEYIWRLDVFFFFWKL